MFLQLMVILINLYIMNNKLFTSVELLVVITIIAVLIAAVLTWWKRNDIDEECVKYNSKKILEDIELCDKLYLWNCKMKVLEDAECLQKLD